MVTVKQVRAGSLAAKKRIMPGDILLSINGNEIGDVLDYQFYLTEPKVTLLIHRGPELIKITIKKGEYEDIGLEFETFLMDEKKSCTNQCIFCFIDQMPCGMRETLYFKDDDTRLSFLMGNYVTMTNLKEHDIDRIIQMHLSPMHISVHTTEPQLRVEMMHNRFAGKVLSYLERFREAGIAMECQIVLCRGINDGLHLQKTMEDLSALFPAVNSVSIVPAGITCHRENLPVLTPFSPEECGDVIDMVEQFSEHCMENYDKRLFFCSDEFYLTAKRPLPQADFYEGFPQIENGVGMIASMQEEFLAECHFLEEYDLKKERHMSIATGQAAYPFLQGLVCSLQQKSPCLCCHVYPITNDFFGHNITVAGLVTGRDLIAQLKGKDLGEKLVLPSVMLRHEADKFLDDLTPDDVTAALGVPVEIIECDGASFVKSVLYE